MSSGWVARIEPMQPGVGDGVRRVFDTQQPFEPGTLRVFVNGLSYAPDDDIFGWTDVGRARIELNTAPAIGDAVEAFYDPVGDGRPDAPLKSTVPATDPWRSWRASPLERLSASLHSTRLFDELVDVVDNARAIHGSLGMRPTIVRLVWVGWSRDPKARKKARRFDPGRPPATPPDIVRLVDLEATTIGVGEPRLLRVIELKPQPLVAGGVSLDADVYGETERGTTTVSQVSVAYPQDLLMGLAGAFRDPDDPDALRPGVEFFWELELKPVRNRSRPREPWARDERAPARRRYQVVGVPERSGFGWSVQLQRADGDRRRDGSPAGTVDG